MKPYAKCPALLALLLLSACQKAEYADPSPILREPSIYKDVQTGCEYIAWNSNQLTARADSDGSHRGCKTPLLEK